MERTAELEHSYAIHNQKRSKVCSSHMNKREKKLMPSLRYLNSFLRAKERFLFRKKTNWTWIFKSEWDAFFSYSLCSLFYSLSHLIPKGNFQLYFSLYSSFIFFINQFYAILKNPVIIHYTYYLHQYIYV